MVNRRSAIVLCCAAMFFFSAAPNPAWAQTPNLYYLYQRTTYLENLTMNGAWWANPALTGEITEKTASTVDITPLGLYQFTIISAKYLFPFGRNFGAGIGIMGEGVGPSQGQSTQVTDAGATYSSHFSFSNPSFQCGLGMHLKNVGSAGLLFNIGEELLPQGDGTSYNYPVMGLGAGVLTPFFFNTLSLSLTAMATWHFWQQEYLDYDGKAGCRFRILDDFILGSLEYTFSFKSGFIESFYTTSSYYQVGKGLISIRFYKIAGLLLGYSSDFGGFKDMGGALHAGLELRHSDDYPYFGGYELAVGTNQRLTFTHQVWVGYCFRGQPRK
jgi:hypothetical protein